MAVYVVATRRKARGKARSARSVLTEAPDVKIRATNNPDIVIIEISPRRAETLRDELGDSYLIEPQIIHSAF